MRANRNSVISLTLLLAAALLLAGCGRQGAGTAVVMATATSAATATAAATPTETVPPTATQPPTATPTATVTAAPTATAAPKSIHETDNILVLGMDQRPGEGAWRTDTIMVVAIDYDANQVGVVSIPRDLWVEIPGYEYQFGRINQADFQGEYHKYPGGGPKLAADIIEANLGIPTQHWVRLRLEALPELVDALGGVTVTLTCPLHELTPDPADPNAYLTFDLPAGNVFLDGEAAAKFARYRYASSDFSRARRQQQLIWAIRERALQVDAIPKIPELWRTLADTFKTDLGLVDVVRLARLGIKLNANQVHGLVFSNLAIQQAMVGDAQVLKVIDRAQFDKELAGLFSGQLLAAQGLEGTTHSCPTPGLPTWLITPTVTPETTVEAAPEAPVEPTAAPAPEVTPETTSAATPEPTDAVTPAPTAG